MSTISYPDRGHSSPGSAARSHGTYGGHAKDPLRDRERRVRAVFGLNPYQDLPKVSHAALLAYYRHLLPRLPLPFLAEYFEEGNAGASQVVVTGLADPHRAAADPFAGLLATVQVGSRAIEAPLVDLKVPLDSPCFEMLEDYWYWLWNWQP